MISHVKDLIFNFKCSANPLKGSKLRVEIEDKINVLQRVFWLQFGQNRVGQSVQK